MDFVPYAFCSSVIASLENPLLFQSQSSSKMWQSAARNIVKNRKLCLLEIAYGDGDYLYRIIRGFGNPNNPEYNELRERNYRIDNIFLSFGNVGNRCSFEEIKAFTLPCVKMSAISLQGTECYPKRDLLELLFIYKSIFQNFFIDDNNDLVADFVRNQLKKDTLKFLYVEEITCSVELMTAIEELVLHKMWENVCFRTANVEFDMKFFEKLFEKPVFINQCFEGNFSFSFDYLKDFKKELQTVADEDYLIVWRRTNGVKIEVEMKPGNTLAVKFRM